METKFDRYIQKLKQIKPASEKEFDAATFLYQKLAGIEFSKSDNHPALVARATTELLIVSHIQQSKEQLMLLKNYIRFFMIALDEMVNKAEVIAKDAHKELDKPDRLSMVFYQKKLSRALKRMTTSEAPYDEFVQLEVEADNIPTFANIEISAFIFQLDTPQRYKLVFTGITRGFAHTSEANGYQHLKNIETLF